MAPAFSLPFLRGAVVDLAAYRGRCDAVVWFSRGFTCPFCRVYTDSMRAGYAALREAETEIIQVAPNLLDTARRFFAHAPLPFPFACDPDKRLYAVYVIRDVRVVGPIDPVPGGAELAELARQRWQAPIPVPA